MKLTEVIGVLGFLLGVVTFALTRWERRKKLTIDLFVDHGTRFREEIEQDCFDSILVARFINDGQRPIAIDSNSLMFNGNGRQVPFWKTDCFGKDTFPTVLTMGASAEVGIFIESFAHLIEATPNSEVEVSVTVRDLAGKCYRPTAHHILLLEVEEIKRHIKTWLSRITTG